MGLSNIEVKRMNRNSVLQYMLKVKEASKNSIAEALHLSIPTIAQSLRELEEMGLVEEGGMLESIGGRRARSYQCIKDARLAVGLDITLNHVNIVVINLAKEVVCARRERIRLHDEEESYGKLRALIQEAIEKSGAREEQILGLGISLPAIIDETGTKIYTLHEQMELSPWLHGIVQEWFPFPVILENDANSSGKAEAGLNRTGNNMIYFFVSQTVGGAIILNGKMNYGRNRRGGEFGHMTLIQGGRACYCGRIGCVDAYCSTRNLSDWTEGNLDRFFRGLEEGNPQFRKVWEEYLDYLALAVHNLATALDNDIIIGGYLGQYIGPYIGELRKRVQKMRKRGRETDIYLSDPSFIRPAVLKYEASSIGVASVFVERFISGI